MKTCSPSPERPGLIWGCRGALPAITGEAGHMLATLVQRRKFLVRRRQRLLGEAEVVWSKMDLELIERLPSTKTVKTRLNAVRRGALRDHTAGVNGERLEWLTDITDDLDEIATKVNQIDKRPAVLVSENGSTLTDEVGIGTVSAAELLVRGQRPRTVRDRIKVRPAVRHRLRRSVVGEGDDEPARHRLDLLGNRQVNRILHSISVTQSRCRHAPAVDYLDRKRSRQVETPSTTGPQTPTRQPHHPTHVG